MDSVPTVLVVINVLANQDGRDSTVGKVGTKPHSMPYRYGKDHLAATLFSDSFRSAAEKLDTETFITVNSTECFVK